MTLTPSDIEQKTFSTALRGYNLDEVDDFLDEVVRSMRKLQEELETAQSELETKSTEPDDFAGTASIAPPIPTAVVEAPPPPPPVTPIDESAVGKALIAAQETAERIVNDARSEADEIVVNARSEAETFEESRLQRKAEAEQEITRIDSLVNRVKSELADLSVAVGAELEEMSGAIDIAITDLDGSPGEQVDTGEDLEADEELSGDHDGQNIVGVGAEPLEGDIDEAEGGAPAGRRRHRSDFGEPDATADSGLQVDSEEDDTEDESEDDSEDGSEDDYFNFPDGDDEDDESETRA